MAAGVTLIIPVAYFVFAQGRMAAYPERIAGWKPTLKNEAVEKSAMSSNDVGQTMTSDKENATIADAQIVHALAYAHITRRAVPLREWPRYAATAVAPLPAGSPVSILETHGNWLKVEARATGARGYIRKEYVGPQNLARN